MIALIILWVLVGYASVAVLVARAVVRSASTPRSKWLAGVGVIAIFVLIPTWDAIIGHMYFRHLCETQSGQKVYKTVKVGKEFFNADGSSAFIDKYENRNQPLLATSFEFKEMSEVIEPKFLNVQKDTEYIIVREAREVIASRTIFRRFGGWVVKASRGLIFDRAESCGLKPGDDRLLLTQIIVRNEAGN